jgi:hypothetical protein
VNHPLAPLTAALAAESVRYVLIGVAGANLYGPGGQAIFITDDFDLFVPSDPDNLVRAWQAVDAVGWELTSGSELLDRPRDRWLAERVVERRALTRVRGPELAVDITLVMASFEFETGWRERREFIVDGTRLPVARLLHIITSKSAAGREKDRLFLATHKDALEQLRRRVDFGRRPEQDRSG